MTNGNDSAYPQPMHRDVQNPIGLTKREYFAAMAMQGLLSNPRNYDSNAKESTDWVSISALKFADALIEQLKKASL